MSSLPKLRLGERREFMQGSYELRGCIDNRYVFRIRNRVKNRETYVLWTESQWRSFVERDEKNMEFDNRNAVMFQLHLDGRTYVQGDQPDVRGREYIGSIDRSGRVLRDPLRSPRSAGHRNHRTSRRSAAAGWD